MNDDDNAVYISEEDRDRLIGVCNDAEDWLYEDGSDAGFKVYQSRTYELRSDYSTYKNRKDAHDKRKEFVPISYERLNEIRDEINALQEKKPWITEEDVKDVLDRVSEAKDWLDEKVAQ